MIKMRLFIIAVILFYPTLVNANVAEARVMRYVAAFVELAYTENQELPTSWDDIKSAGVDLDGYAEGLGNFHETYLFVWHSGLIQERDLGRIVLMRREPVESNGRTIRHLIFFRDNRISYSAIPEEEANRLIEKYEFRILEDEFENGLSLRYDKWQSTIVPDRAGRQEADEIHGNIRDVELEIRGLDSQQNRQPDQPLVVVINDSESSEKYPFGWFALGLAVIVSLLGFVWARRWIMKSGCLKGID